MKNTKKKKKFFTSFGCIGNINPDLINNGKSVSTTGKSCHPIVINDPPPIS